MFPLSFRLFVEGQWNIKHQLTLETSVSSNQPHARQTNKGALPEKTVKAFDNYLAKESCFIDNPHLTGGEKKLNNLTRLFWVLANFHFA